MKRISIITYLGAILLSLGMMATSCKGPGKIQVDTSLAAKKKALLWKITSKKTKTPSYLFGTIHMIEEDDYFMPEYVERSLGESEKVFFEINTDDMSSMGGMSSLMGMIFMEEGVTLKDLLNEEDYKKVKDKLSGNPLFMLLGDMTDRIKPMFLSTMLEQGESLGGGGGSGSPFGGGMSLGSMKSYEMELTDMAKKQNKPIAGLETIEFQMGMFDSISLEEQAKMLVQSLEASEEDMDASLDAMVKLYTEQDIPGLYKMIQEQSGENSDFEEKFLIMRNENWIPLMEEAMVAQPTFFAVGAGHLGGEKGVVALLRKQGYLVTPVLK